MAKKGGSKVKGGKVRTPFTRTIGKYR